MSNLITDLLQKVFQSEKAWLIARLQKHKRLFIGLIVAVIIIAAYFRYPGLFQEIGSAVGSKPAPLWSGLVFFIWLLVLTYHVYGTQESTDQREFFEDFRHGLEKWEYYGEWRTERDNNRRILIVTNSGAGGIVKPCRLWTDYVFEFETKIIRANTSWIVRAKDILNYVMLQCQPTQLVPHFRVNGNWIKREPIPLPDALLLNTWFGVRTTVTGTRVVVIVRVNDREIEVLNRALLEPRPMPVNVVAEDTAQRMSMALSYPMGSVGFRESGTECAHFRNVRVRRI